MILTEEELYKAVRYLDNVENIEEVLSWKPRKEWIKEHEQIQGFKFLPIRHQEFLLTRLFKDWHTEIRSVISNSSAVVTVRLHYIDRNGKERFNDGIGAAQINNQQPIDMAFPLAKTLAKKDALEWTIFGKDLNRKEVAINVKEVEPTKEDNEKLAQFKLLVDDCTSVEMLAKIKLQAEALPKEIREMAKALIIKKGVALNG